MAKYRLFATDQNRHPFDFYITKKKIFLMKHMNVGYFGRIVAWSNPPFEDEIINNTIRAYKRRGIRGYLCVPDWEYKDWHRRASKLCIKQRSIKGKNSRKIYFAKSRRNRSGIDKCPFDSRLFHFNFS